MDDVNIDKIQISNNISFGYKNNNNDYEISPLSVMLPKIREQVKSFDETEYMSLLIKDDKLLTIVNNSVKKEFDREPVYNQKYLKTMKAKSM